MTELLNNNQYNNNISIYIPKTLNGNIDISNHAIAVYSLLQILSVPSQLPIQCITIEQLAFYLFNEIPNQRSNIMQDLQLGLNELIEYKIIKKISEYSKNIILDCSNLKINTDSGNFVKIFFSEIQQIFNIKCSNNHFSLLRYFICLISTLNWNVNVSLENNITKKGIIGYMTIDFLSKKINLSKRTIMRYNNILEEANLIYVNRYNAYLIEKDNKLKRPINVYGRYKDKEYIETFANAHLNTYKATIVEKPSDYNVNEKRKLAQMYNYLLKENNIKYSHEELQNIYQYVLAENQKYKNFYISTKNKQYLKKIRDINIFEKYGFEKEKD